MTPYSKQRPKHDYYKTRSQQPLRDRRVGNQVIATRTYVYVAHNRHVVGTNRYDGGKRSETYLKHYIRQKGIRS